MQGKKDRAGWIVKDTKVEIYINFADKPLGCIKLCINNSSQWMWY
jgi:hypothetical protein